MDPFRTSPSVGTCPRCKQTLESEGAMRLLCLGGCGEWHAKESLDQRLAWHQIEHRPANVSAWPWGVGACPICSADMTTSFRGKVRFDYCSLHGVWLDTGEATAFLDTLQKQ